MAGRRALEHDRVPVEPGSDGGADPGLDGCGRSPTVVIGWAQLTGATAAKLEPNILTSNLDWSASGSSQTFNFTQDGLLRGFVLPTKGLQDLRVHLGGAQRLNLPGPVASSDGDMLKAAFTYLTGETPAAADYTGNEQLFFPFDTMQPLTRGADRLVATTGSEWATTSPDNEICTYTVSPPRAA